MLGCSRDALSLWGAEYNQKWAWMLPPTPPALFPRCCLLYFLPAFSPPQVFCPLPALLSGSPVPPGGTGTKSSDSQLSSLRGQVLESDTSGL